MPRRPAKRTARSTKYSKASAELLGQLNKTSPNPRLTLVPPGQGRPIVEHIDTFLGRLNAYSSKLYLNPDEAYRQSRTEQDAMRRDPVIMAPLRQRQLATALLDWQIVPEDENDVVQKHICQELEATVRKTPNFLKMKMALLEAIWFGRYAVNLQYKWNDKIEMNAVAWRPIHGDKLTFEHETGNVGVYVGGFHYQQDKQYRFNTESRVRMVDCREREALVIHKHEIEDGTFFDAESAGGIHGIGLRTRVYWQWYMKQNALQWLMDYMQRVGLGISIWYYEAGNKQDEDATRKVAEQFTSETTVLAPYPIGTERPVPRFERVEPNTGGASFFKDVLDDYWGDQIHRMIAGQTLTSKSENTGLGSNQSSVQQDTFNQIVSFDSQNLAETLTSEFVQVLAAYNCPGIDWKPRFEIVLEENDPKEMLEAAKVFQDMGGELGEDQVREIIGLSKPAKDDRILEKSTDMSGFGGFGMPGKEPPQEQPTEQQGEEFPEGTAVNLPDGVYSPEEVRDRVA